MTSQSRRLTMVTAAAAVLLAEAKKPSKKANEEMTKAAMEKAVTHGLAMLGNMACDIEAMRRSADACFRLDALRTRMVLSFVSKSDNSNHMLSSWDTELRAIVREYEDNGRDHTGTAGNRQDDEDGGSGRGGAG
jgi:hypothetical protein